MNDLTPAEIQEHLQNEKQEYLHHSDLVYKEYYRTLKRQQIKINLELGNFSKVPSPIVELYEDNKSLLEKYKQKTSKNHIGFFTINPQPGKTEDILALLKKCLEQFLKKTWIRGEVYYTFEQRGETDSECGKGLHMHILFLRNNKRPYNAKIETYNTFKKLYGQGKSQHKTMEKDYKFYPYEFWADKIAYMDGTAKWDEDKHEKQNIDKKFREEYKLKQIYKVNILGSDKK